MVIISTLQEAMLESHELSSPNKRMLRYVLVSGLWGMESTSVIQQKGPNPTDEFVHKGDSRRYHRSGEKPLDPTTQFSLVSRERKTLGMLGGTCPNESPCLSCSTCGDPLIFLPPPPP